MNTLSTHVLDTATGKPAEGLALTLEALQGDTFTRIGAGTTNADGRVKDFLDAGATLPEGVYRMRFETGAWLAAKGEKGFYPYVEIVFEMAGPDAHYHVPLLLSPYGFSTYRGS